MTDMRISDLPVAPNVNDAQQFEVNDSGNSRRITFQQMRGKIKQYGDNDYAVKTHTHTVEEISNATELGRLVLKAATPDIARAALQAKSEAWIPNIDTETVGQLPWSRLSGVSPALEPYVAGDGFQVGDMSGIVSFSTSNQWFESLNGLRATSSGTVRIKFNHLGMVSVRRNGINVAQWAAGSLSARTLDFSVVYGDYIRIALNYLVGNGSLANDIKIYTNNVAPIMVPVILVPAQALG